VALADRVQRIIASPQTEWPVIAAEPATPATLYSSYIVPLALIAPICSIISAIVFLHRSIVFGVIIALVSFIIELIGVFVVALVADALSPSFNGVKDQTQALKWIAYSYTPRWVAGIAALIPVIGALIILLGGLYSLYLLYLGVVPVMRVPQEKAAGYTIVLVVATIVLFVLVSVVVGILVAFLTAGAILSTGGLH
jgi:hypothetical protein